MLRGDIVDWLSIRNEYVTGNISCAGLAEKYGCSAPVIKRKCREEKWVSQRQEYRIKAAEETDSRCAGDRATAAAAVFKAANELLMKLSEGIQQLSPGDYSGIASYARSLKTLSEIFDIKSDLDIKEQELRISILRKQASDEEKDNTINIVMNPWIEEFAQ